MTEKEAEEVLENGTGFRFSIFEGSKTENPEADQNNQNENTTND